jgi:hypothetical protein
MLVDYHDGNSRSLPVEYFKVVKKTLHLMTEKLENSLVLLSAVHVHPRDSNT